MRFNFKDTNATARNELWETYSDMFEKVFKVRPTVAYKQDAKYEDLVSFVITSKEIILLINLVFLFFIKAILINTKTRFCC